MARKRTTLPKDFEALLAEGDLDRLKAVFDGCSLDARGGSSKRSALGFAACPAELMRWLAAQGADLHAADHYDETPLHSHAGSWNGQVEMMIALGADVNHGTGQANGTPLHKAARSGHPQNVASLLAAGARADAPDDQGRTPLDLCLLYCSNAHLERAAAVATLLLQAGSQPTPRCQDAIIRIGERFEFHRAGFNPDRLDRASEALDRLYALFAVPPVPGRTMHDGVSPIRATAERWEDRFDEL